MKQRNAIFLTALTCIATIPIAASAQSPPPTRTVDQFDELHGQKVADPYRWLEEEQGAETLTWVDSQMAYTRSIIDRILVRDRLKEQLAKLYEVTTTSKMHVYGDRYLFFRHEGKRNHAVLYMRKGKHSGDEVPMLDPNLWSQDGTVALDWYYPSRDGSLIAYGRSESGSELSTLSILDTRYGEPLEDNIPHTRWTDLAWDPDKKGFLYTRYPEPGTVPTGDENYYRKVYHHKLGDDWHNDPVVVGDLVKKEEMLGVSITSDDRFNLLSRSVDWVKNDLYYRPAGTSDDFKPIAVGLDGQVGGDAFGDQFILLTNVDAPRYRIVAAPIDNPTPDQWKDLIGQQKGKIKSFQIVGGKMIVHVSEDVQSKLYIHDMTGKRIGEIPLPTSGSASSVNGEPDGDEVFFDFDSFGWPPTGYRYVLSTGKLEKLFQADYGINSEDIVTEQVWYNSKDGTRVPMFITHRKGIERNGKNPTILYGYGGFDVSIEPGFSATRLPWLQAGGVYAVANLRGGGEFGKQWHEAGRLGKKQNVFDDFIAAAEKLIADKYTDSKHLGIYGGSNGGLLVGACAVQRPDLYSAVVCAVPLLDMVRYHEYSVARLWIPEYGSADDAEQFKWLYAYSPYHHVKKGTAYPAMLITTAMSDGRVNPFHAFKMTAALQAANGGDNPILLRCETKAGHGQGKPISKRVEEQADVYAFFMSQLMGKAQETS